MIHFVNTLHFISPRNMYRELMFHGTKEPGATTWIYVITDVLSFWVEAPCSQSNRYNLHFLKLSMYKCYTLQFLISLYIKYFVFNIHHCIQMDLKLNKLLACYSSECFEKFSNRDLTICWTCSSISDIIFQMYKIRLSHS